MEAKRYKFGKEEHLKSGKTIELLFGRGKSVNGSNIRAVYLLNETQESGLVKVAFSVPKKRFKLAVSRNLIKRRMREAYRINNQALKLHQKETGIGLDIMFVYTSKQILSYKDIEEKIKVILTRLIELGEVVGR
jgi:ribonuclease P protein component